MAGGKIKASSPGLDLRCIPVLVLPGDIPGCPRPLLAEPNESRVQFHHHLVPCDWFWQFPLDRLSEYRHIVFLTSGDSNALPPATREVNIEIVIYCLQMLRQQIIRYAALTLLLSAAVDIFVVDLSSSSFCDDSTSPLALVLNDSGKNQTVIESAKLLRDDCFCCCSHIVVSRAIEVRPVEIISFVPTFIGTADPLTEPALIDRPPRA